MIRINGENVAFAEVSSLSLLDYLEKEGFNRDYLVVEINEIIIPKKNYAQHFFHDGDSVEIISFVGGG